MHPRLPGSHLASLSKLSSFVPGGWRLFGWVVQCLKSTLQLLFRFILAVELWFRLGGVGVSALVSTRMLLL